MANFLGMGRFLTEFPAGRSWLVSQFVHSQICRVFWWCTEMLVLILIFNPSHCLTKMCTCTPEISKGNPKGNLQWSLLLTRKWALYFWYYMTFSLLLLSGQNVFAGYTPILFQKPIDLSCGATLRTSFRFKASLPGRLNQHSLGSFIRQFVLCKMCYKRNFAVSQGKWKILPPNSSHHHFFEVTEVQKLQMHKSQTTSELQLQATESIWATETRVLLLKGAFAIKEHPLLSNTQMYWLFSGVT